MPRLLITALLIGWLASACSTSREIRYPVAADNVSFEDVLSLPYANASASLAYGEDPLQQGRLWRPAANTTAPYPVVVFIHGGCWLNSFNMQHTYPFITGLAQAGFAVWSLEYRRTGDPGGGWPGTFEDIRAGIDYLNRIQGEELDSDSFAIVGHSAGGHLALLAGSEYRNASVVIGLAAITDIVEYSRGDNSCQTATAGFMGAEYQANPELYRQANPAARQLHRNTRLLQGSMDQIVPLSQSRLRGADVMLLEGASHFDWIHPGSRGFDEIVKLLRENLPR